MVMASARSSVAVTMSSPAAMPILAYWIIAVPVGYAFGFHGRFGAVGIWIGLAVGLAVAAFALSWRFHRLTEQTFSIRT